jgi:transcriptional regulator with XRE-family HTH domain
MSRKRKIEPFASFGADMKAARNALGYSQKTLAEIIGIDPRYLANIENSGSIPSLPVFYEIITICKLPAEKYFYPDAAKENENKDLERISSKLRLIPEKYLPLIESTIDAALRFAGRGGG